MTGKIKWASQLMESKKNGMYKIVTFELFDSEILNAHAYLDPLNKNYERWESVLKVGNILTGLSWKNKKGGLVDGDSLVNLS